MKPILVIADDITGAAEMAGLALSMGCRVRFTTQYEALTEPRWDKEVTVLATDTRSMKPEEAIRVTRSLVEELHHGTSVQLFKKCDSALRGHLCAELNELMSTGYRRALILAANPSKGRCISENIYTVNGVPIAETLFATDPEFPARSSNATELVGGGARFCRLSEPIELITIGESRSEEEVGMWINRLEEDTLLVGAADAFRALLLKQGCKPTQPTHPFDGLEGRRTLIVCGSTVRHNLYEEPLFRRHRVAECPMPDALFEGGSPERWIAQGKALIEEEEYLLLRIPQQVKVDREKALHLRNAMAETVAALIRHRAPEELVIEGGASAFAILEALGWSRFTVENEVAAGVVRLRHTESGVYVTFKPGSYEWGDLFA